MLAHTFTENKHKAVNCKVLKTLMYCINYKVTLAFAFAKNKQQAELNNIN